MQVDAKTVERWITKGRVPYRRHRYDVAAFFGVDESYIWPDALDRDQIAAAVSESEIIAVYPHRWAFPGTCGDICSSKPRKRSASSSTRACSCPRTPASSDLLTDKAKSGVRVRILLGDPDSPYVAERGEDEGIDDAIGREGPERDRDVPAAAVDRERGVPAARHGLYNSIYRADDQVLVNTHIYGMTAATRRSSTCASSRRRTRQLYLDSFERVWESATPIEGS